MNNKSLIILGEQHTFTELELRTLEKKFNSFLFIKYREEDTKNVIAQLSSFSKKKEGALIVLNTKASVPNTLLVYLSKREEKNIEYLTIKSFMSQYLKKCYIPAELRDISFLEEIKPFGKFEKILKVMIDYIFAIILLVLTSPFILYSVYKIKKESPGSIFFKQDRVGINGEIFTCYKFRSMHENSHHDPYTREDDSRIFPWGNIMRKTRIDEIPQLINIFKGEMHLIGPRAEWNILVENYEKEIPYYHERHLVKPGITGWAQVNYPYGVNSEDTKQKLMYDLYYIKNWSLWLETRTVWKTIIVILNRRGI